MIDPDAQARDATPSVRRVVFWWHCACRSVMPLFREMARMPGLSVRVIVEEEGVGRWRKQFGWSDEVAETVQLETLSDTQWAGDADRILAEEADSLHIFGGYQRLGHLRAIVLRAISQKRPVAIMAECPLNMDSGWRRSAKDLYLRWGLPRLTRPVADASLFMACLSGRRVAPLMEAGWPARKIYPFGYFPAPRDLQARPLVPPGEPPRILAMGVLARFKGVDVLLRALRVVLERHVPFACEIVGDGPERRPLESQCEALGLTQHVRFHGFIPDTTLDNLITASDVLVCPGYAEPWAIRVNEGLQAGLAVVASDRLGASELLGISGAGVVFRSGDAGELAEALSDVLARPNRLNELKRRALQYSQCIHPAQAARYLLQVIEHALRQQDGPRPLTPWHTAAGV